MSFHLASSIEQRLSALTWAIAQHRWLVIALITLLGIASPMLRAMSGKPTTPSMYVRSGGSALAFSSAVVAVCSLLHFSDLRWLPLGHRGGLHVKAPGGIVGQVAGPLFSAFNTVGAIPAEWRAAQVAIHTAIVCAGLALVGALLVLLSRRRAQKAEIRLQVWEQVQRLEPRLQQIETHVGLRRPRT